MEGHCVIAMCMEYVGACETGTTFEILKFVMHHFQYSPQSGKFWLAASALFEQGFRRQE